MRLRKQTIFVTLIAAAIGLALGLNETRHHGYVVAYSIVAVFFLTAALVAVSSVLLFSSRSRSIGLHGITGAAMLFASFYGTIAAANALGAWDHEMVSFGPDVEASLVILFDDRTTDAAIYDFVTNVVATPHPGGGSQHLPGIQSLLMVRVGNHDGYALQLSRDATEVQRRHIRDRIKSSKIVWRVFENVAPDKIILQTGG